MRADGSAVLLLADDEPLLERLRNGGRAPVMLQLADHAPVELRCRGDETGEASGSVRFGNWAPVSSPRPIRGLLWITGRLWLPDRRAARRMALQVADACPDDRLLDLDHGATLVRLDPGSAVLADGDGSAALGPVDLAAARPDPFCRMEDHWLGHLEEAHPDVMIALGRHLPRALRGPGSRVRPLGVDRCGLRLRVETPDRDHDVRLAFESEATTPDELRVQVHKLVGCQRS